MKVEQGTALKGHDFSRVPMSLRLTQGDENGVAFDRAAGKAEKSRALAPEGMPT
jgi:hypothetical protein